METEHKIRLDKWLWVARFYKTRSIAAQAVLGGKIHVNGQRVKAAKLVQVHDQLDISLGQDRICVVIWKLSDKRGPAQTAQLLYQETAASSAKRKLVAEQRKLLNTGRVHWRGKPDKRQRRELRKLSGKIE